MTALRDGWLARIVAALDDSRVADALRVAARPPEPAARVPAELAVRMAEAAGGAMDSAGWTRPSGWRCSTRWCRRRAAHRQAAGLPAAAGEAFRTSARRAAGLVPEVARLLGLPIPPPPGPRRPSATGARAT